MALSGNRRLEIAAYGAALVAVVLAAKAAHTVLDDPSLAKINGEGVISTAQFPVALAAVAVVLPWRNVRIALTILLWAFVILGGMSIGLYYFPAAVALSIAAICWVAAAKRGYRPTSLHP